MVKCKKCSPVKYFHNLSKFRKHQWRVHREIFNRKEPSQTQSAKNSRKYRARKIAGITPQASELLVLPNGGQNKVLTALDILNKLKDQKDLLDKMVSLISHMMENPE